jgi:hypothetical protein
LGESKSEGYFEKGILTDAGKHQLKPMHNCIGTIRATFALRPEDTPRSVTGFGVLALDKTEQKSRSPNRAFPERGCSKLRALGTFGKTVLCTFGLHAKSASRTFGNDRETTTLGTNPSNEQIF